MAPALFPRAPPANPSIFYDRAGRPAGAAAVYNKLTGRYDVARALTFAPTGRTVAPQDTAAVAQAYAQAYASARNEPPPPVPADNRPLFQAMFTDRPQGGVSQAVNTLWGQAKSGTLAGTLAETQAAGEPSKLLDLFRDAAPPLRKSIGGKV